MHWTAHLKTGPKRVNHAAAAVGKTIFTFGGYSTGEEVYTVEGPIDIHVLNIYQLCWQELPKPLPNTEQYAKTPYQRYGHTAVAFGKNIYLWGGRNEESACNRLFCFNTETLKWSTPTVTGTIPCSRDGHSACIINNSMYIFGGYEEEFERYSQDVYALDLKTMHWTYIITEGPPPIYRDFNSGTAIGTRMYIFGGRSDRGVLNSGGDNFYPNDIVYLDTETNRWHKPEVKGDIPVGRRSHSAVLHNGKLYIFGGYNSVLKEHYNDFHCFCPKTNTWSIVPTIGYCPNKRRRQVCIVIENKMYLFGGTSPSSLNIVSRQHDLMGQYPELIDHDDLHVLDLKPSLRTLCMLYVTKNKLTTSCLPNEIIKDLNLMRTHLSNMG
ncbi:kelch domain-containing protein 3 [Cimex lectularius]|uniref:Kelch domain-containing protein 3 n=1 Tax=Cimex lectularius TaxID=79782 RepID=A0A8I6RSK6_CIMLE|nr:kelch domain-containing protein 3 [Cimex lectularius]